MKLKLLSDKWHEELKLLLSQMKEELVIATPFLTQAGARFVKDALPAPRETVYLLTNLEPKAVLEGLCDPYAMLFIAQQFRNRHIASLRGLHAKVYVVDGCRAIITSANLTEGGLFTNYECGVLVDDNRIVADIRKVIRKYFELGQSIPLPTLQKLAEHCSTEEFLKEKQEATAVRALSSSTFHRFQEIIWGAQKEHQKRITNYFAGLVEKILSEQGPLTTHQIHKHIKNLCPELCPDHIDRIIGGRSFGKLWKHHVRNAQQYLKRRGVIELVGGVWRLKA